MTSGREYLIVPKFMYPYYYFAIAIRVIILLFSLASVAFGFAIITCADYFE